MNIRIKVDSEWQDRIVELCNTSSVGRFVVIGNNQYERYDFGTPKFIKTKIRRY